jgi:hypothetical protein
VRGTSVNARQQLCVNEPGMKWRLVELPDLKVEDARKMRWAWRSPLRPWNGKMRGCDVVVEGGQSYCCLALLHSQNPAATQHLNLKLKNQSQNTVALQYCARKFIVEAPM